MKNSRIAGVGHYVPERVVTNQDLEKLMDTNNEWIVERTGIKERRYFDYKKDTCANMAANATKMALESSSIAMASLLFPAFESRVNPLVDPCPADTEPSN